MPFSICVPETLRADLTVHRTSDLDWLQMGLDQAHVLR